MREVMKGPWLKVGFACVFIVWGIQFIINRQRQEQMVKEMLQQSATAHFEMMEVTEEDTKRLAKFWTLWQERDQRDIGPELAPLLTDDYLKVRHNALRACMLLESAACEMPLKKIIARPPAIRGFSTYGAPIEYKLALGRVQSRNKKGKARIDAFLHATGLTWPSAVAISKKVNSQGGYLYHRGSDGEKVTLRLLELMHDMQRKGDNLESLWSQLTLKPPQKVMLEGSLLSVEEEADLIINHALSIPAITGENHILLAEVFPRLGPKATDRLLAKLQDIADHPEKYPDNKYGTHRGALMLAAVPTYDKRFIPVFKQIEKDSKSVAAFEARSERARLQDALKKGWYQDL
jgi:hypothetical protein